MSPVKADARVQVSCGRFAVMFCASIPLGAPMPKILPLDSLHLPCLQTVGQRDAQRKVWTRCAAGSRSVCRRLASSCTCSRGLCAQSPVELCVVSAAERLPPCHAQEALEMAHVFHNPLVLIHKGGAAAALSLAIYLSCTGSFVGRRSCGAKAGRRQPRDPARLFEGAASHEQPVRDLESVLSEPVCRMRHTTTERRSWDSFPAWTWLCNRAKSCCRCH